MQEIRGSGGDNIVENRRYTACGQTSQKFYCRIVAAISTATQIQDGFRSDPDKIDRVIKCLNERMSIRSTAKAVGCSANIVQGWR